MFYVFERISTIVLVILDAFHLDAFLVYFLCTWLRFALFNDISLTYQKKKKILDYLTERVKTY
jgi:hypothetical protein